MIGIVTELRDDRVLILGRLDLSTTAAIDLGLFGTDSQKREGVGYKNV